VSQPIHAEDRYRVSEAAFFHAPTTSGAIQDLASSKALTIYLGAGCSVDRTGHTWSSLIEALMRDPDIVGAEISASRIVTAMEAMSPLEAATVVKELAHENLGDEADADSLIANRVAGKMQSTARWRSGELLHTVIRFAYRIVNAGGKVALVTTNYDTFVEQAYAEVLEAFQIRNLRKLVKFPVLDISVQGEHIGSLQGDRLGNVRRDILDPPTKKRRKITLEYLHGRVTLADRPYGRVAFAEDDYVALRPVVLKLLHESLKNRDVLILGSGLTDAPLLNALLAERSSDAGAPRKLAMFAVPSFGMNSPGKKKVMDRKELAAIRAEALGFQILFPDFFSQVAQFMRELSVQFDLLPNLATDTAYYDRLKTWWTSWRDLVNPSGAPLAKAGDADVVAQSTLFECVQNIRRVLARPGDSKEILKLELWVRWNPSPTRKDGRGLKLWATSTSILAEKEAMRFAPLDLESTHMAVKAFQSGRPEHWVTDKSDSSLLGNHWQTFLSCPVVAQDEEGQFPVGAITLKSQSRPADHNQDEGSKLRPTDGKLMERVCRVMTKAATDLLIPTTLFRSMQNLKQNPPGNSISGN
jgi:SIR2-like domain